MLGAQPLSSTLSPKGSVVINTLIHLPECSHFLVLLILLPGSLSRAVRYLYTILFSKYILNVIPKMVAEVQCCNPCLQRGRDIQCLPVASQGPLHVNVTVCGFLSISKAGVSKVFCKGPDSNYSKYHELF